MIYDCWIKKNRKKYENTRVKQMAEEYEIGVNIKEIVTKQIEIFKQKLQEIQTKSLPLNVKAHILPFVCQYDLNEPPTQPLSQTKFQQMNLYNQSSTVNFQRPLPQFIPIDPSELIWLSPGIITDVKYDFANQFLQIYTKGQSKTLTKSERLLFEQLLPSQIPLILTNYSSFINGFTYFFSYNPQSALSILQYISSQKVSEYFYDKLISIQVSKSTLQSMKKLIFQQQLPKMTINYYIIKTMQKCEQAQQSQQQGLARMIVALLKQLIKAKKVDIKDIEQQIRSFGIKFSHIEEVAKFYKIIVQTNN